MSNGRCSTSFFQPLKHALIEGLCANPEQWQHVIGIFSSFCRSDDQILRLQILPWDFNFVCHCVEHLEFSGEISASIYHGDVVWSRLTVERPDCFHSITFMKSATWTMRSEFPDGCRVYFDPKCELCERCGSSDISASEVANKPLCFRCWHQYGRASDEGYSERDGDLTDAEEDYYDEDHGDFYYGMCQALSFSWVLPAPLSHTLPGSAFSL